MPPQILTYLAYWLVRLCTSRFREFRTKAIWFHRVETIWLRDSRTRTIFYISKTIIVSIWNISNICRLPWVTRHGFRSILRVLDGMPTRFIINAFIIVKAPFNSKWWLMSFFYILWIYLFSLGMILANVTEITCWDMLCFSPMINFCWIYFIHGTILLYSTVVIDKQLNPHIVKTV